MIRLATGDLAGAWRRLEAAGVEFVEDPTDHDTVSIATCRDPEGNLVRLIPRRP
jgi:predicted enzyme related to lactoylglutathione lyase